VYRAAKTIPQLLDRLETALRALTGDYEIIFVDDRSPDNSWEVIQQVAKDHPNLLALRLSRNFGQHYALTAGMAVASKEWVVVMDCDLEDPPEDIAKLIEKTKEGYDIVLARRVKRAANPLKVALSRLFYYLFGLISGYRMDRQVGSFRVMRWTVVSAFNRMTETYRMFGAMIHWLGFNTGYVDIEQGSRIEGRSGYTLRKLIRLGLDGMISFSNRPLYIALGLGFFMAFSAGAYGLYEVYAYFFIVENITPGWLSSIMVSTMIGGLILMTLGILGLYIGRIYDQTKMRPLYVVDSAVVGESVREKSDRVGLWREENESKES